MNPVLLMESEESVIKDVTCSLKLVNIPVVASWDVSEAKRLALQSRPDLVLARARLSGDENAGVSLARALADDKQGCQMPVVVLLTPGERSLIKDHRSLFVSEIGLPVEFPAFTRQVQQILFEVRAGAENVMQGEEIKPQSLPEAAPSVDGYERNMLIAYDVQHKVMTLLRQEAATATATSDDMISLVQETTRRVCESYTRKA